MIFTFSQKNNNRIFCLIEKKAGLCYEKYVMKCELSITDNFLLEFNTMLK